MRVSKVNSNRGRIGDKAKVKKKINKKDEARALREEPQKLQVYGELLAVYDVPWKMVEKDNIIVFPHYNNENLVFKRVPPRLRSQSSTIKAIFKSGDYGAVYACEYDANSEAFFSFVPEFVNHAMRTQLPEDPVTFKFIDENDENDKPMLFIKTDIDREKGYYAGCWAKTRWPIVDPPNPGSTPIKFHDSELDKLEWRHEINMAHTVWSRYRDYTQEERRGSFSLST